VFHDPSMERSRDKFCNSEVTIVRREHYRGFARCTDESSDVATGVTRSLFHQDHRCPGTQAGKKVAMGRLSGEAGGQRRP
jgi:hypothetical protein